MSFLWSCDSDCYNAIASLPRDLSENLTQLEAEPERYRRRPKE
jgi:hypothetical protein